MLVRLTQAQGDVAKIDKGIAGFRDHVLAAAREVDGYAGAMFLVDRTTGKAIGLTMWQTEDARERSFAAIQRARATALQEVGSQQDPEIELYEVAVLDGLE